MFLCVCVQLLTQIPRDGWHRYWHGPPCRRPVPPTPCRCAPAWPLPHTRCPALSNTRYHFVLISANLTGEKQYSIVNWVCISLVSGEAKYLFLHLQAIWILLADECHCPVFGKGLVGVSSLHPSPPQATGSVAPLECYLYISSKAVLPTRLASQGSWVLTLRSPRVTRAEISAVHSLPSRCTLPLPQQSPLLAPSTSPHQRDFRNQICLKKKEIYSQIPNPPSKQIPGLIISMTWGVFFQNIPLKFSAPERLKWDCTHAKIYHHWKCPNHWPRDPPGKNFPSRWAYRRPYVK